MSHRERAPNHSAESKNLIEDNYSENNHSKDNYSEDNYLEGDHIISNIVSSNTISSSVAAQRAEPIEKQTIVLEVSAAYNRDGLPMPKPNGPNGRRVLNLEMLMNHPLYWEFLNERETEEVLMELYIARTRRMQ